MLHKRRQDGNLGIEHVLLGILDNEVGVALRVAGPDGGLAGGTGGAHVRAAQAAGRLGVGRRAEGGRAL